MIEDDEEEAQKPTPTKWSWLSLVSNLVAAMGGWFRLCAAVCDSLWQQMDRHVDYKTDRLKFQERSALEIEALTRLPAEVESSRT